MVVDFERAAKIITRHFLDNGYDITVEENEINWLSYVEQWEMISYRDPTNNYWTKLFTDLSEDKSVNSTFLNHYKCTELAKIILKNGSFHASHLPSHSSNDSEEYYHYMKQIGHELATGQPLPRKVMEYYSGEIMSLEQMRDKVYILCFTDDESNNFFWDKYACQKKGARFRLKYTPTGPNQSDETGIFPLFHLRKMFYDVEANDKMSFIKIMNSEVRNTIGYQLMMGDVYLFATFYKRHDYMRENETRLSFDLAYLEARNSYPPSIDVYEDGNRKFIKIPISNKKGMRTDSLPFDIELIEVICGSEMADDDYLEICRIVESKYVDTVVTRFISSDG